jgi:hypothetical protein
MAKRPMKAPGTTGGSMTKHSPLGPVVGQVKGTGMKVDDASATDIGKGVLRPARAGSATGAGDAAALGVKGTRGRTATNAGAQFRITAKRTPASEGPYPGTLAAGKILPAVMGSRQNFLAAGRYGPM